MCIQHFFFLRGLFIQHSHNSRHWKLSSQICMCKKSEYYVIIPNCARTCLSHASATLSDNIMCFVTLQMVTQDIKTLNLTMIRVIYVKVDFVLEVPCEGEGIGDPSCKSWDLIPWPLGLEVMPIQLDITYCSCNNQITNMPMRFRGLIWECILFTILTSLVHLECILFICIL